MHMFLLLLAVLVFVLFCFFASPETDWTPCPPSKDYGKVRGGGGGGGGGGKTHIHTETEIERQRQTVRERERDID